MKRRLKWKMVILVWVAIYPTITILYMAFGDWFAQIKPLPLQTLVTTSIVVPLMVFVIMPLLEGMLTNWLNN
jgi:antibiotic biosynthesis monooxygenase (ABM) superfamily enzyme